MKNMKKIAGLVVMTMSLSISAFAAEPAFDTPQEWLAASQQEAAAKLKEEASMGYSENYSYMAAPAFDSPQEWLAASQQEKAAKLKEEASMHGYSENYDYMAASAFEQ